MRWEGRRQSSNIEDKRGTSLKGKGMIGGVGSIIIILIIYFMGGNPDQIKKIITPPSQSDTSSPSTYQSSPEETKLKDFISVVLADTEDVWGEIFKKTGNTYTPPKLVIFTEKVESGCGIAASGIGPFYCPADEKVYIDLSFSDVLINRLNAPGDFALAYVIAHEVGHHVQNLLGLSEKMSNLRETLNETEYNEYSVKMELQADFYAGIWAHHDQKMHDILEKGDIEEALNAASAVGDDTIQKRARGYVTPDSFTHGTSEQRTYWFKKGFETGDITQGDTFNQ